MTVRDPRGTSGAVAESSASVTAQPAVASVRADARLAGIDMLRGFAALAVVLYHARAEYWVGLRQTWSTYGLSGGPDVWLSYALSAFSFGWLGVPVFFVLSGYCIHRSNASRLSSGRPLEWSTRRFYWRRFMRIYPVFFVALCLTALVDSLNAPANLASGTHADGTSDSSMTFLVNVALLQGLLAPVYGSNTVFWTLSIEFHLYMFYPVVLWIILRRSPLAALGFAAAVSTLFCATYYYFDFGKVLPYAHGGSPVFLSHLLIWVAGAYLAEVEFARAPLPNGWLWTLTWVACLLAGIVLQERGHVDWSPLPLAVGAFGLVAFALRVIVWSGLTSGSVGIALVGLGVISYSLYATHRISFGLIHYLGFGERGASLLTALYCSALAIAGAGLVYWLVERHSIRR